MGSLILCEVSIETNAASALAVLELFENSLFIFLYVCPQSIDWRDERLLICCFSLKENASKYSGLCASPW